MKLINLVGFFLDLSRSLQIALLPTLKAIFREPSLIIKPLELRRVHMAHVWAVYGDGLDESSKPDKEKLLRGDASGIVLELGAGYGHTAQYLDKERVTAYVALEPNALMHSKIRTKARTAGFIEEEGTFLLLGLPAGDIAGIQRALKDWAVTYAEQHRKLGFHRDLSGNNGSQKLQVDTIVSILTLCSVPKTLETLRALVSEVLAPGGNFLFYEHVRSERKDVAWWQDTVTPLWKNFFDGCVIGQDSISMVKKAAGDSRWESMEVWGSEVDDDMESLFWRQGGKCVKKVIGN